MFITLEQHLLYPHSSIFPCAMLRSLIVSPSFYFFSLVSIMPVVPKDFITCSKTRPISKTRPQYFHNAQVYISRQPVKRLYGPRRWLWRGRGLILFNWIFITSTRASCHRTGMSPCAKFYFRCAISILAYAV